MKKRQQTTPVQLNLLDVLIRFQHEDARQAREHSSSEGAQHEPQFNDAKIPRPTQRKRHGLRRKMGT